MLQEEERAFLRASPLNLNIKDMFDRDKFCSTILIKLTHGTKYYQKQLIDTQKLENLQVLWSIHPNLLRSQVLHIRCGLITVVVLVVIDATHKCRLKHKRSIRIWWKNRWIKNWHSHQILKWKSLICMIIQCSMSQETFMKNAASINSTTQIHLLTQRNSVRLKELAHLSTLEVRWDQVTEPFSMDQFKIMVGLIMLIIVRPDHLIIGI